MSLFSLVFSVFLEKEGQSVQKRGLSRSQRTHLVVSRGLSMCQELTNTLLSLGKTNKTSENSKLG